ncbi:MAG: amidohydrolase family protein [Candidatus Cybelea sp.]
MRQHVKLQVDVIKILATGGVLSYGDVWDVPQFNLDEVQAVVEESTKFHRKVAAHAHGDEGIAVAVEGGVHSVEHGTGVSEKTLHNMQQRGTYLVPTLWALDSILQPGNPNHIPPSGVQSRRVERTDRLWHRCRHIPARAEQQGLHVDGRLRDELDRCHAQRNRARCRDDRHERSRRAGTGKARRRRRFQRRSEPQRRLTRDPAAAGAPWR